MNEVLDWYKLYIHLLYIAIKLN